MAFWVSVSRSAPVVPSAACQKMFPLEPPVILSLSFGCIYALRG
jgi:hypothetical protein